MESAYNPNNPYIQPKEESSVRDHLWHMFLDLVQVVVMSLVIFLVVYLFVFQPNQVRGASMDPTFHTREYLLTDKVTYRWVRQPERGDIVVFKSPENNEVEFIKRIIGLPGDTIRVEGGIVYLNNQILEESYLPEGRQTHSGAFLREGFAYTVPEGGFIVFGDNRDASSDSRDWGPVPNENMVGRAWFRYWPLTRLGIVTH